jgi:hypothetical protein
VPSAARIAGSARRLVWLWVCHCWRTTLVNWGVNIHYGALMEIFRADSDISHTANNNEGYLRAVGRLAADSVAPLPISSRGEHNGPQFH